MEQDEQGWSFTEEHICADCIDEVAITAAVAAAASTEEECSFCGRSPAASLDVVMDLFVKGLKRLYERTIEVLYYDDDVTDRQYSEYLVWEYEHIFVGDGVIDAVIASFHDDEWVATDFAVAHHGIAMLIAWGDFCRKVKFETRYVIWLKAPEPWEGEGGEVPLAQVLNRVGQLADKYDLVSTQSAPSLWWRAQLHEAVPIDHTASRLGTVPADLARQPNRMSPAGIPMFYGATDPNTALAEVTNLPGMSSSLTHVTWAAFHTSRPIRVVDFTKLPPVPSVFDPEHGHEWHELQFLHSFVGQLSSKAKPEWEAVDYVPTQILTEYFLRIHGQPDEPVDGLVYGSAVTGAPAIVLDVGNDQCVEVTPGWEDEEPGILRLGLDASSIDSGPVAGV